MNPILNILFVIFLFLCHSIKAQNTANYFIYTVTEQDKSLWGICQQNNTDVETVKALNNMNHHNIHIGDKLKIPSRIQMASNKDKNKNYILHLVRKEDKNLWRICENYAVLVDSVVQLNKMPNYIIKIGDKIKIPASHLVVHTITKSDKTLWDISRNYGINLQDLKNFNHKKNHIIRVGEKILIPKKWITKKIEKPTSQKEEKYVPFWENLGKPVFDLAVQESKFPYRQKKSFSIHPSLLQTLTMRSKLTKIAHAILYQHTADDSHFNNPPKLYYYSVEEPFLMDLVSLSYHPITAQKEQKIEHGYNYHFVTILEIDSAQNTLQILPVFLYENHFGDVKGYFGNPINGSFACCVQPHPLAHYSKNNQKEIIGFSKLLNPNVLHYTETTKYLQGEKKGQVDSVITILQLETFDLPTLIDIEEFKNGVLVTPFTHPKRRRELGY